MKSGAPIFELKPDDMRKIRIGEGAELDVSKLIESRLLIQANSGGGKSWCLRRLLEQTHGQVQQIVLDPEGEFGTLREKYDYILAGRDGDVPAEPRSAAMLARKLLELGVSAIIDLYELDPQERKRFARLFLDAMIDAPKDLWHPVLVVVDEAHFFCPEKGQAESAQSVTALASRGRKRGFCAVLATQRLSKLNKDAAAECNNKLIGRTTIDIDRKRAAEELGFTGRDQELALRQLEAGEFFAFGTAISRDVVRTIVGPVDTSHPKIGAKAAKVAKPTLKMREIIAKLGDVEGDAKREAETLDELKRELAELKRHRCPKGGDPADVQRAVRQTLDCFQFHHHNIKGYVDSVNRMLDEMESDLTPAHEKFSDEAMKEAVGKAFTPMPTVTGSSLTGAALKMGQTLASRHPMKFSKSQLGAVSGYRASGSTFRAGMARLREGGYVIERDDKIEASESLLALIGTSISNLFTPEEVVRMWQNSLSGIGRRMFDVLLSRRGDMLSKEDIGAATGATPEGSTFRAGMAVLRANELVQEENGCIAISENLFV